MSSIVIFKTSFVNALRSSLGANLERYLQNDIWLAEVPSKGFHDMQTEVEVAEPLFLDLPENGNLKDIENAIRFHRALRQLTPLQARDPRLWTRMTHIEFWQYMRFRWPIERHMANLGRAARFVESRYFVPQSQSRALLRNGIARLWWAAQLSHDPERENPYELTGVLLSMLDIAQQILERGMGRADNVIKAFLEFLLRNKLTLLTGGDSNRTRIRRLAKHLNMYGGVSLLDCLSQSEVMGLLDEELARILGGESSKEATKA